MKLREKIQSLPDAPGVYLFTEAPGRYTVTVDAGNFGGGGALAGYTATPTLHLDLTRFSAPGANHLLAYQRFMASRTWSCDHLNGSRLCGRMGALISV